MQDTGERSSVFRLLSSVVCLMADETRRIVLELLTRNRAAGELAAFRGGLAGVQTAILSVGRSALALAGVGGGLYGVKRALGSVTREAVDFEYELAKVGTMLVGPSMRALPQLGREIERLSVQYGKGAKDLNAATYTILSNQIPAAEAMKVLETNIRAAKGGFTDTAVTVKASVGLLKAYQLETERVGYVTNIMHKIVQRGNLVFGDVAENIGTVSSTAAVLNVDLEALGATIATLTRSGVPVDKTFTAIRNILNTFKTPTEEASRVAAALGFNLDYTSIKGAGLVTIMQKLAKANERQLAVLMPNVRGFEGFAAGLQNAAALGNDYAYMLSDVNAQEEALAKALATTQDGLDKSIELFQTSKRIMGEGFLPIINELTSGLNENADAIVGYLRLVKEGVEITLNIHKLIREMSTPPFVRAYQALKALPPGQDVGPPRMRGFWDMDVPPAKAMGGLNMPPDRVAFLAAMSKQAAMMRNAIVGLSEFQGPLPGTEGGSAVAQMVKDTKALGSYTDDLIAKMRRENELLAMSVEERAKAKAIDEMRQAIQRDINIGIRDSAELTEAERRAVEQLTDEHLSFSARAKQTTLDIAQAYARMYDQIDSKTAASFEARRHLLAEEYKEYAEVIHDKAALDEWLRNQQEKLAIDQAKATGTIWEGMAAGLAEMQRTLPTIGQLGADLAVTFRDGMVRSLSDAVFEAENLSDALKEVARSMARMTFEWSMQQAVTAGLAGLAGGIGGGGGGAVGADVSPTLATGVHVAHRGGRVGDLTDRRWVDSSIFANAPRFHGLRPGETAVIAQDDEVISRPGGGAGNAVLREILAVLKQRQTVNVKSTIVDHRDVVTKERMESREGERLVMGHVGRNG